MSEFDGGRGVLVLSKLFSRRSAIQHATISRFCERHSGREPRGSEIEVSRCRHKTVSCRIRVHSAISTGHYVRLRSVPARRRVSTIEFLHQVLPAWSLGPRQSLQVYELLAHY